MSAGRRQRGIVGLLLALLLCQAPLVGATDILLHCAAGTKSDTHAHHVAVDVHAAHQSAHHTADTADDECGVQTSADCGISAGNGVPPAALIGADPCSSRYSSASSLPPASATQTPPYRPPSAA